MFDKLQQLKQLHDLQQEIKKEKYDAEKNGVKLVMNGELELEEVRLNPALSQEEQERTLREAYNGLIKKVQMAMAQKFRGMM